MCRLSSINDHASLHPRILIGRCWRPSSFGDQHGTKVPNSNSLSRTYESQLIVYIRLKHNSTLHTWSWFKNEHNNYVQGIARACCYSTYTHLARLLKIHSAWWQGSLHSINVLLARCLTYIDKHSTINKRVLHLIMIYNPSGLSINDVPGNVPPKKWWTSGIILQLLLLIVVKLILLMVILQLCKL